MPCQLREAVLISWKHLRFAILRRASQFRAAGCGAMAHQRACFSGTAQIDFRSA
jgi:hypothetical protein